MKENTIIPTIDYNHPFFSFTSLHIDDESKDYRSYSSSNNYSPITYIPFIDTNPLPSVYNEEYLKKAEQIREENLKKINDQINHTATIKPFQTEYIDQKDIEGSITSRSESPCYEDKKDTPSSSTVYYHEESLHGLSYENGNEVKFLPGTDMNDYYWDKINEITGGNYSMECTRFVAGWLRDHYYDNDGNTNIDTSTYSSNYAATYASALCEHNPNIFELLTFENESQINGNIPRIKAGGILSYSYNSDGTGNGHVVVITSVCYDNSGEKRIKISHGNSVTGIYGAITLNDETNAKSYITKHHNVQIANPR